MAADAGATYSITGAGAAWATASAGATYSVLHGDASIEKSLLLQVRAPHTRSVGLVQTNVVRLVLDHWRWCYIDDSKWAPHSQSLMLGLRVLQVRAGAANYGRSWSRKNVLDTGAGAA